MEGERYFPIPHNEQETTISFSRDSEQVYIWTNDRTMITKLDKLCKSNPQTYRCRHTGYSMLCEGRQILDKEYICSDKTLLSFKPKKRASVPLTEEQKEERRERLREIHERRKICERTGSNPQ